MGNKRKRDKLTEEETYQSKKCNTRSPSTDRESKENYSVDVNRKIIRHHPDCENLHIFHVNLISEFASKPVYSGPVPCLTPVRQTRTEPSKTLPYSKRLMRVWAQETYFDLGEIDAYRDDTFCYKLSIEEVHLPSRCLQHQTQMNEVLRLALVKWITDVHHRLYLCQETLFKTVNIIDRFFSLVDVHTESLQMLALASLLIASKYEEVIPPDIDELLEEINVKKNYRILLKKFERFILKAISFNLSHPTSLYFLEYYADVCIRNADLSCIEALKNSLATCRLVLELSLQDYQLSQIKPSLLSICLWLQNISNSKEISGFFVPNEYYSSSAFNDCFNKVSWLISNLRRRYPDLDTISKWYKS
ncbi:cyclin-O protein B isoform X2 [Octopus bimaculoides]|uniref:Cyclin-like domain-containing protein n=1 Tax=Octopus bimaculoides TaxID=37653 RepID=A0A0L8H5N0_OCTBM|nr:cyclin-O protein B isoform X2 [Octopus bimaculoides]|eukprot:XP_014775308.1 PREDICTED: cyclin-O protein B-like [Octopus bimaculoides]